MGERRRVAIATVLAMRPQLLVLDEPSANLDPRARRELLDVLERIDRTMLVVTHDLPFAAELCERAVILSAGRIVADDACGEVLADEELLADHDLELPAGLRPGSRVEPATETVREARRSPRPPRAEEGTRCRDATSTSIDHDHEPARLRPAGRVHTHDHAHERRARGTTTTHSHEHGLEPANERAAYLSSAVRPRRSGRPPVDGAGGSRRRPNRARPPLQSARP